MTEIGKPSRPDVAALTKAGDRDSLRRALRHPEPAIRARAADALAKLADRGSAALLCRALRSDTDDHVREEAAVALGRLRDVSAFEDLVRALRTDRSEHVREESAVALGRLGDRRAIDTLLATMDDRYTMVHRAAAEALDALGPDALNRLVALAEGPPTRAGRAARAALDALDGLRPGARWRRSES